MECSHGGSQGKDPGMGVLWSEEGEAVYTAYNGDDVLLTLTQDFVDRWNTLNTSIPPHLLVNKQDLGNCLTGSCLSEAEVAKVVKNFLVEWVLGVDEVHLEFLNILCMLLDCHD